MGSFIGDHLDTLLFRGSSPPMNEPIQSFTGDQELSWPDGYNRDGHYMYVNDQPLPATVAAFLPQLVTADR